MDLIFMGANAPSEVRVFESPMFGKIRVAGTSEEPWFNLPDVCKSLGISNPRNVRLRLDEEDVRQIDTLTKGGKQSMTYVSESGLYDTIIRSDSEKAKPFRKWVTSEVLPTIRKTGNYGIPQTYSEALMLAANQAKMIEEQQLALEQKQADLEKSHKEVAVLSATITQMQPKVTYYDTILSNKSCIKVTQIAQDYGMSAKAFNKLLCEHKLQRKVGEQWILYRQFLDKGYVHSKPIPITHHDGSQSFNYLTVWTQKGRIFLYEFLKSNGVLPMIERKDNGETH